MSPSGWPAGTSGRIPGCRSTRTSPQAGRSPSLSQQGLLQPECERIFRLKDDNPDGPVLRLHQHQREAIEAARTGSSYVLTTGTGSGKSLAYIIPIVDRVLAAKAAGTYRPGIKAIVVYPMNALANSQLGELEKFLTSATRRAAGDLRPLHRAGVGGRPGQDHREPARHPAHQLRDARARPHPARGARPDRGSQGFSSWSWTSCTPTGAGRARTWPSWSAGSATPATRRTSSASARPPR